ncbi:reticulon-like protein B11 [Impatiens glandulifera]|uniref:reticulon-like protein B11 n=1 Tax=Impatiens glandulifera TaxID=253017 RepID=UPI001FB0FCA8|nr:reticulon-like protein B11 [Impatiens glandulifera]
MSRISVHQALGGGAARLFVVCQEGFIIYYFHLHDLSTVHLFIYCFLFRSVADVLLWRRRVGSVFLLAGSTSLWLLFECAGYNLLTFVSNIMLFLVFILFFWAKSASLLNRPLPPLPDLDISEESVLKLADAIHPLVNRALSVAREIAVVGDLKFFLQVAIGLWVISFLGSCYSSLTIVYFGIILSLSVPMLYDKFQDQVDDKLSIAHRIIEAQYMNLDDNLRKIQLQLKKEKKIQ